MRLAQSIALLLTLLFLCSTTLANSKRNIGSIANVDEVSVDAMRGDSLGLEQDRGTPLFDTDFARVARLEANLKAGAAERLRSGGLRVVAQSENVIRFNVFGGTFASAGCSSRVFFMLQVQVCLVGKPECSE